MLVARRRITFDRDIKDWIEEALRRPKVRLMPLSVGIVTQAAGLPDDPLRDPVDRILVATCREHSVALVTEDERIRESELVRTDW
jgi:PIN domain nuclease of toxin-antitoxin system